MVLAQERRLVCRDWNSNVIRIPQTDVLTLICIWQYVMKYIHLMGVNVL